MPVSPSSVLPVITEWSESGVDSGSEVIIDFPKSYVLSQGSGRFTGNLADPRQERDFVDPNQGIVTQYDGGPPFEINFGVQVAGFNGEGINKYYPSPREYRYGTASGSTAPSGVFISYPPDVLNPAYTPYRGSAGSGIFNFRKLISDFSNAPASKSATDGINNFTIFNPYVHYFKYEECGATGAPIPGMPPADPEECAVKIPFVADVIPTSNVFDRYKELPPEDEPDPDPTDPEDGE